MPEFKFRSVFGAGPIVLHYHSDMNRGQREGIITTDFLIFKVTGPSKGGYSRAVVD